MFGETAGHVTHTSPVHAESDEDQQIANAIKASGAIVHVEPEVFLDILEKADAPLVVCATGGFFFSHERYLTSYKGLFLYTQSKGPLSLPSHVETMRAKTIWIPH